ncbi:MAG: hypothetical protein ACP5XB_22080 [Isosphaeraceae bacterium]
MQRDHRPGKPSRPLRPLVEGLEARELLSTASARAAALASRPASSAAVIRALSPSAHAPFPDPTVIANSIELLYGPNSQTPRTPTPAEIQRETFTAKFIGTYTVGPPRFSDRSLTLHAYSKDGGSNQFLMGKLQMVLFPPANPHATPNPGDPYANQVTGLAALFTQNYLQTGGLLLLDLNGSPVPASNPDALPTHLNWTFDSFASNGPYIGPSLDFYQGAGVLDIKYLPDSHPQAGTLGSGRFVVAIQGVINTSQITSAISKVYN